MNVLRVIIWLALVLIATSYSATKRVAKARGQLMEQYRKMPDYESLPERALSWREAVAMMMKRNIEYAQARLALDEALRQERAVYRELIPPVNLGYYYNRALFQKQQEWGSGGQFDINVIFNLPDLMRLPVEKYTRSLAVYKAEQDCKQKRLELESKLYLHFLEEAREDDERLTEEGTWEPEPASRPRRREERNLRERERWGKLCELLNNHEARWKPVGETLPPVKVEDYQQKVVEPGEITQVMMALELEASRLRKKGVALRYWPGTQINFYSPTLFNMSGGNMGGFTKGVKDVRVSLNLYTELDTRLDAWQEYQSAKESHELLVKQLKLKMYAWREKMRLVMESWAQYEEWSSAMEEYISFRRRQGAQDAEGILGMHRESLKIQQELREQEGKNAERIGALIQEYGLPESSARKDVDSVSS